MILGVWFMLLVVCVTVDSSHGQETRDERVSGCEDSTHNLESVILETMRRVGFTGGEQKMPHMEQILQTLLNITAAQERREIEHRQDIEQNRGVIANMTAIMDWKESQHRQDIEDLRKEMREQSRNVIANMTATYDRMETERRQQISNSDAMLETKVTELRQDLEGLKEQIRDLRSNVTTEIKRRVSEQEERLKNISAASEKDIQSLKSICSAGKYRVLTPLR